MTADIELLPLPDNDGFVSVDGEGNETFLEFFTAERTQDYARANVAHATAAKDAEIEALRAALKSLRAHMGNALMVREGIIKALEEVRDGQDAEIERLRAENKDLVKSNEQVQKLALDTLADRDELKAEIEALRVELDRLRGEHVRVRRDHNAAEAQAEQLMEVLQGVVDALGPKLHTASDGLVYLPEHETRVAFAAAQDILNEYKK